MKRLVSVGFIGGCGLLVLLAHGAAAQNLPPIFHGQLLRGVAVSGAATVLPGQIVGSPTAVNVGSLATGGARLVVTEICADPGIVVRQVTGGVPSSFLVQNRNGLFNNTNNGNCTFYTPGIVLLPFDEVACFNDANLAGGSCLVMGMYSR